ncbi:11741_t:CDS:10 [Diversispora eburnea]|uniref:11741_t:CDS:1 n=1 Tax=Diversispora eburnea TaxID=1213867 RepID=A0A9N8VRB0_9GLOM|nr:11741_t:CDS:10 [Diversispora eburnea]
MRILITGASGLLGRAVYKYFNDSGHQVLGLAKSRLKNAERRPDVAEKNRDATLELNVNVPANIATFSKTYNFLLIHISTDYVFDGKNPPYNVDDKPNPLNFYGETKYQSEIAVQKANSQAIILRVPILYGEVEYPDESAVNILLESVKLSFQDVAKVIKEISEKVIEQKVQISGILHYSGNESFTKYQICEVFSKLLNIPIDHLKPVDSIPTSVAVNRPYDCHLSTEKLLNSGIDVSCIKFNDWWKNYLGSKLFI